MYIWSLDRFLLVCPAMSSLHVSPHCQPRIWGQDGFPSACGWKAARVVCRVEASLWISHFQDLTVKFLLLLLPLLDPTEMASSDLLLALLLDSIFSCWAPDQLSLSGHEGVPACGPGRAPSLTTREGWQWPQPAEPQQSHCSYPNFNSVLWISAS